VGPDSPGPIATITNPTEITLQLADIRAGSTSFVLTTEKLPLTVAAGGKTNVTVTFKPEGARTFETTLDVRLTGSATATAQVALSGTGVGG